MRRPASSGFRHVGSFCRHCGAERLTRSTRDVGVNGCSRCLAIERLEAPPGGGDKLCPACGMSLKPERDEAAVEGQRLVYHLLSARNE